MSSTLKAQLSYKKTFKKYKDIINNLDEDDIDSLYSTDRSKYQRYRRYLNKMNSLTKSGLLSQDFLNSIHQESVRNLHERDSQNHLSRRMHQDTQQRSNQVTVETQEGYNSHLFCENCLQKQNSYIINKFGNIYHLDFTLFCSDNIAKRRKFRRVKFKSGDDAYSFYLCKECSNYLNPNINCKEANLSKNT